MYPGRIPLVYERSLFWTYLENQGGVCSEIVRNFYGVGVGSLQMECSYPDEEQWDGQTDVVGEGWEQAENACSS